MSHSSFFTICLLGLDMTQRGDRVHARGFPRGLQARQQCHDHDHRGRYHDVRHADCGRKYQVAMNNSTATMPNVMSVEVSHVRR